MLSAGVQLPWPGQLGALAGLGACTLRPGEAAHARERAPVLSPAWGHRAFWKGEIPQILLEAPRRKNGAQLRSQAPSFPASGLRRTQWWAQIRPWCGERAWAAEPLGRTHSSSGVRNHNETVVGYSTSGNTVLALPVGQGLAP